MNRAEELASLAELSVKTDVYGVSMLGADQLGEIAAELRRLDAENAKLRDHISMLRNEGAEIERLRAELEAIYSTEPVAWTHSDFGSVELSVVRRVGWSPLINLPVRKS
jgi:hypothetical protein